MKTIEYPIKEMVSFEMDENGIWWLEYNQEHEYFPQKLKKIKTKYGDEEWRHNKKGYKDFVSQTNKFCLENNFILEGEGFGMVGEILHQLCLWSEKDVLSYSLPFLLFPRTQTGCDFNYRTCLTERGFGDWKDSYILPYYGNPHYKKYIDDNDGECPLPLPEDVKWWEV